jgi:hypothetical protein
MRGSTALPAVALLAAVATTCASACTSQNAVVLLLPTDGATEAATAVDTGGSAAIDTQADLPLGPLPDSEPDQRPDAQPDAEPDVLPDTQPDSPPDRQPDTQRDARPDAAPDAQPDTQPDTRPDTQPDARPDTQPDARPDTPTNLLFSDDFSGGWEVHWLLSVSNDGPVSNGMDGSDRIAVLDATANDYSRLRCNLNGEIFTNADLVASMKLRIEKAPSTTRTVRLDVRQASDTENVFYAVGATIADDGSITKVGIFKKVDDGLGGYTICSLAQDQFATPVAMGQWRTIKLAISGTTSVRLAAYFEDAQVATYYDDCVSDLTATDGTTVPNGGCLTDQSQTGLGIQVEKGIKASVDDVLVTRL